MPGGIVAVGYVLAILSSVCNGTFAAPAKLERVQKTNSHPLIFNTWVAIGVGLSSLLSLAVIPAVEYESYIFTAWGLLSGLLFVLSGAFSFLAIDRVGLGIGQAVWGGCAVTVSFLWGVAGPNPIGQPAKSLAVSIVSMIVIVVGIIGAVLSSEWSTRLLKKQEQQEQANKQEEDTTSESSTLLPPGETNGYNAGQGVFGKDKPLQEKSSDVEKQSSKNQSNIGRLIGLMFAACVGIFGGSTLVPLKLVEVEYQQLAFLPSFGLGVLLSAFLVLVLFGAATREVPVLHWRALALPGILGGCVWNIGNICSMYAQSPQTPWALSYGIAYPILQCAIVVSGTLGVLVFKEIKGVKPIVAFFSSVAVILIGCVLLGLFGPGAK